MADTQRQFRTVLAGDEFRWTNPEQFHITMRFLGNVQMDSIRSLIESLRSSLQVFPPLLMRARGTGCFPNPKRPRVLWVGVSDAEDTLPKLHQAIHTATQPFAHEEPQDRFSGHITLARIRFHNRSAVALLEDLLTKGADQPFGDWTAEYVHLMQSHLSANGARHVVLEQLPLRVVQDSA